jgi:chromosome segregation ATPase
MLRTCVLGCALAGFLGLAVGCNRTDTKPTPTQREAVVSSYQTQLVDLNKKIDDLKAKADKAAADEKPKLEAKLKEATARRDAFAKKLDELKAAADKVDAVKKDAEAALAEVKKAVE